MTRPGWVHRTSRTWCGTWSRRPPAPERGIATGQKTPGPPRGRPGFWGRERPLPLGCCLSALGRRLVELLLLRRALHRGHRRLPAGRDLSDLVEIAHAHELLVPHRRVAVLLRRELAI